MSPPCPLRQARHCVPGLFINTASATFGASFHSLFNRKTVFHYALIGPLRIRGQGKKGRKFTFQLF